MTFTKKIIFLWFFSTICFSQLSVQISQQSNFASGKSLTPPFPEDARSTDDYLINENLFNVSISKGNFYFNTLLEYSDPPVFGVNRTKLDSLSHSYYLEYVGERLNVKLGNIYSLYTRGLIFNTYQDYSTDFDNSLMGVEISYNISDRVRFYSVVGADDYEFRTRPDNQLNDLSFSNETSFVGSEISLVNDFFLNLQFCNQNQLIDKSVTTIGGQNIIEYYSGLSTILGNYIHNNEVDFLSDEYDKYSIRSNMFGGSLQGYVFGVDMYVEYALNKYTKIEPYKEMGDDVNGNFLYSSLYFDLFDAGVTYEFKRYDAPYFIQTTSSPPIVYKEASSVLVSRIAHNMNFTNEIGHQFDINYPINDIIFFNANLSTARKVHGMDGKFNSVEISTDSDMDGLHNWGPNTVLPSINNHWEYNTVSNSYQINDKPSFMSILFMDKDEGVFSYSPYRQIFMGVSGSLLDDRLDFSVGFDSFNHIAEWGQGSSSGMNRYIYNLETLQIFEDDYWNEIEQDYDTLFEAYSSSCSGIDEEECISLAHDQAASEEGLDYSLNDFDSFSNIKDYYIESALDSINQYLNSQIRYQWNYTTERAFTIPTYFAWNVGNGDSFLLYFENQWRKKELNKDKVKQSGITDNSSSKLEEHIENYLSLSYKNRKGWTISLFYNKDNYKKSNIKKDKVWSGIDLTVDFDEKEVNSNFLNRFSNILVGDSKVSLFYGSQRGGLVCANGICAQQPEFSEGLKVSYTRIF